MERPREGRAVWRALLLPSGEGANGPQGTESAGAQHPAAWRASPPFDAGEADLCARQRGFQLLHRGWFLIPELKDGSEASNDEQADNVSNEALYVIGLHGSGDKNLLLIARLGGGKGSLEQPYSIGFAMPRVIRSSKKTRLVRFL